MVKELSEEFEDQDDIDLQHMAADAWNFEVIYNEHGDRNYPRMGKPEFIETWIRNYKEL